MHMKKIFNPQLNSVFIEKDKIYEVSMIALAKIQAGSAQPRKIFDEEKLNELAASIKNEGLLQPIVVRRCPDSNCYDIIAGERRFRAAKLAGLESIPVIVRDFSDEHANAIALIENIQRENLNPIEEAIAYQRLLQDFQLTHEEIAKRVGKKRSSITNFLRLLELDSTIKELLNQGQLTMGHARALLALTPKKQIEIAELIVRKGLSVREVEVLCKTKLDKPQRDTLKNQIKIDEELLILLNTIFPRCSAKLMMQNEKAGRISLSFADKDYLKKTLVKLSSRKNR